MPIARRAPLTAFLITSLALASCGRQLESKAEMAADFEHASAPTAAPAAPPDGSFAPGEGGASERAYDSIASRRQIIRSANLTLTVDSPKQVTASLLALAESEGGFVVESSLRVQGEDALFADNTLRVPAERFDQAMGAIRAMGEVDSEQIGGEDVTDQLVDLEVRLRTQRQLEERFVGLLAQTSAVTEILNVERELARVRTEIERMDGQRESLRDRVRLATIRVSLHQKRSFAVQGRTLSSEVSEALDDGREGFIIVLGGLIRAVIALAPVGLILAAFGFLLRWGLRRRWARRRSGPIAHAETE